MTMQGLKNQKISLNSMRLCFITILSEVRSADSPNRIPFPPWQHGQYKHGLASEDLYYGTKKPQEREGGRASIWVLAEVRVVKTSLSALEKLNWVGTRYSCSPWTQFFLTKPFDSAQALALSTIDLKKRQERCHRSS